MGRSRVGDAQRGCVPGREGGADGARSECNAIPRNPDGTWVAGLERGPQRPFPVAVGAVIGELTCLRWERKTDPSGRSVFQPVVRCSCGWEGFVQRSNLKHGRTTRCDRCAKRKAVETRWTQKGYYAVCPDRAHRDRLLDRISAIIVRCTNQDARTYPDYGGRGIGVHPLWVEDRVAFLRYLVELPGWDDVTLQLDRIDNNAGYVPGNLRFVTRSVNMANKRRITAREVEQLRQRIRDLEAELAGLRHR